MNTRTPSSASTADVPTTLRNGSGANYAVLHCGLSYMPVRLLLSKYWLREYYRFSARPCPLSRPMAQARSNLPVSRPSPHRRPQLPRLSSRHLFLARPRAQKITAALRASLQRSRSARPHLVICPGNVYRLAAACSPSCCACLAGAGGQCEACRGDPFRRGTRHIAGRRCCQSSVSTAFRAGSLRSRRRRHDFGLASAGKGARTSEDCSQPAACTQQSSRAGSAAGPHVRPGEAGTPDRQLSQQSSVAERCAEACSAECRVAACTNSSGGASCAADVRQHPRSTELGYQSSHL